MALEENRRRRTTAAQVSEHGGWMSGIREYERHSGKPPDAGLHATVRAVIKLLDPAARRTLGGRPVTYCKAAELGTLRFVVPRP